jgi:hypothetical protein
VTANEGDDGSKVIRAHVRARLLGLQLLTVDARIDVAPRGAVAEPAEGHRWRLPRRRDRWDGERLNRAALLLEESSSRLGEAHALRRQLAWVPGDDGGDRPPR